MGWPFVRCLGDYSCWFANGSSLEIWFSLAGRTVRSIFIRILFCTREIEQRIMNFVHYLDSRYGSSTGHTPQMIKTFFLRYIHMLRIFLLSYIELTVGFRWTSSFESVIIGIVSIDVFPFETSEFLQQVFF